MEPAELIPRSSRPIAGTARASRGVVLLVALVSMLILTLAGVSLVRRALATASTSGSIALRYNLAFAGLAAVEAGAVTLSEAAGVFDPDADAPSNNYYAWRQPGEDARSIPAVLQSRGAFPAGARVLAAGNLAIRHVVERLCTTPGPATRERCTLSPPSVSAVAGTPEPGEPDPAPYYRVSARIDAPGGATGYVQAMLGPGSAARRLSWRVVDEP
ncbi:MAG: hypothetical protein JSS46_00195 [Proteobacteria bacterium]|nr:hypothetical protein [Pseudomonadota bacterium]